MQIPDKAGGGYSRDELDRGQLFGNSSAEWESTNSDVVVAEWSFITEEETVLSIRGCSYNL